VWRLRLVNSSEDAASFYGGLGASARSRGQLVELQFPEEAAD